MELSDIEIEPEIRDWLDTLTDREFGRVEEFVAILAENAATLGEPWSRHLGAGVRELRIHLYPHQVRITYWLASAHRIILLTVFYKTQDREVSEIERAIRARKICEAEHGHARKATTRGTGVPQLPAVRDWRGEPTEPPPDGDGGQKMAGFRTWGESKDSREDLPQIVIGMAVTREGIPVRVWCCADASPPCRG